MKLRRVLFPVLGLVLASSAAMAAPKLEVRLVVPCAPGMTSFALAAASGPPEHLCLSTELIVDGSDIVRAAGGTDARTGASIATLTFSKVGQAKFATATRQDVGRRLAILFDGAVVAAPFIVQPIPGDTVQITGPADSIGALLAAFHNGPSPT